MKKIIVLLLALMIVMCTFCACSNEETGKINDTIEDTTKDTEDITNDTIEDTTEDTEDITNDTIEGIAYPFRVQLDSKKEAETREITLYFLNGGDIPYVALSEYMPFVGEIYKDDDLGIPAAEYEISQPAENHTLVMRIDNSSSMDIDTKEDTIEFIGYDYFVSTPGNNLLTSALVLSEDGRGGHSNLFMDDGDFSYERDGSTLIKYDLKEYFIDLIEKDGECYLPLQTVNDLLVSQNYVYVVFNGIELIASSYSGSLIDEMYDAPTGTMSEDFALFNYNELRFMLDTFYGLKPEHGITDFGDYFASTGLLFDLAGTDPVKFDRAIRSLTSKYFDDGHSGMLKYSYLSGPAKEGDVEETMSVFESLGESSNSMAWEGMRVKGIRSEYYPDHPEIEPFEGGESAWFYEEIGDTAIITFDAFTLDKTDYYTEADLENPSDTIELISYAHKQITREDSPIKNVIVDLSCNGGGAADAAVFLMAWLKSDGMATVALNNVSTGAQSIGRFTADINLDGEIDFDDNLPIEINRYILTSFQSFSCGNLVPTALKGQPNITLIGHTSGGGSCVVRPCTTASGTIFCISGPLQISTLKNGSLYNADQGADPDFTISKYETFYDREKLVDFIHQLP